MRRCMTSPCRHCSIMLGRWISFVASRTISITGCGRCSSSRPCIDITSRCDFLRTILVMCRSARISTCWGDGSPKRSTRFLAEQAANGPSDALASSLAEAYHQLGFQTLADQVRRSVRTVRGNQWMFRIGHPDDHPLRLRRELLERSVRLTNRSLLLFEQTSVRMDFSHSAWSDIFFLGMDFPEGARVLNVSVDLGVHGRDAAPRPPIETYLRVIDQPVLRLTSVDLGATADVTHLPEMFDFARDYLGLLKAAVIASGLVPPGLEGCEQSMGTLLSRMVGPGLGLEFVSKINDIPKGSRLAVSTNLLGSLISMCMRATGQVSTLTGPLAEEDRRIVAARAILGEWIGGSGGGWQDSGGVWPGIKLIEGAPAHEGDPEHGISRGRLLPTHHILDESQVSPETRRQLQDSLILVHGGMAQNVGPILEMVTEKYLLRSDAEWNARSEAMQILDDVVAALKAGDVRRVGEVTTRNFTGPIQSIIPWATNRFTDLLIERAGSISASSSGASGCSAAWRAAAWVSFSTRRSRPKLRTGCSRRCRKPKPPCRRLCRSRWSRSSTISQSTTGERRPNCSPAADAVMPDKYYALLVPGWLRSESRNLSSQVRRELEQLGQRLQASGGRQSPEMSNDERHRPTPAHRSAPATLARRRPITVAATSTRQGTASTPNSTSRFAPICGPAASDSRRTGSPPARSSKTFAPKT